MMLRNNIVCSFNISNKYIPIFNLNAEFPLYSFVHLDSSININISSLISPVSIKGNGYTLHYVLYTFHLSGSVLFSLWLMQLMIRFAVSPGCVICFLYFVVDLRMGFKELVVVLWHLC